MALLQRSIPHYRVSLFEKLHRDSRFDWEFYFDRHEQEDASGLPASSYGLLSVHPLRNRRLLGQFTYQTGFPMDPRYEAMMLDLGWTILSNPMHLLLARRRGIKCIGWSKGISQKSSRAKSRLRLAYERFIVRQCDALVVYGQISRKYFQELGCPDDRIFVAQNTVDTERLIRERPSAIQQGEELRKSLGLMNRPIIGYLGKVAPFKQVNRIVAAFEQMRRNGVDAVLLLGGKGSSAPAIEAQIAASPFKNDIRFIRDVPAGTEPGWFQAFDLYVSFAQGGLGVLEAMAHARPILSTPERFPETELLVDNDTAFLSSDLSVDSFAGRMADAITNPQLRAKVATRAEQRVLRDATQDQMVQTIDRAVECALSR